jgi:pyridoxamine 5'-phosphate oxidase
MPQWRQGLTKSLHKTRSVPESRYFQLATADAQGLPYCRTVVYRGLTDDNDLVVISDTRTDKYAQLCEQNKAQVCWYFAKTREQYRFSVAVHMVTTEHAPVLVRSHWERLSDAGKKQFLWGEPTAPRNDGAPLSVTGNFDEVPAHFCVLLLNITKVDYLNLRGSPQYRELHYLDAQGNWLSQSVVP